MFFFLSKVLDVLLSPLTWGVALAALAVPWRGPGGWRWRRAVGAVGLGVLVIFALEPVSNGLGWRLEHATSSTYRPAVPYDVVILLGGVGDERVTAETGEPALNDSVERLIVTHRLLADGRARFAIVSGAADSPALAEHGEARILARQLSAWGIDPARVLLEERARNTRENALFSKRIVEERGFERVLVVTSASHMRRAAECFEAVGLPVDRLPVDFRAHAESSRSWLPRAGNLADSTRALRELAGLYIYRARGYGKPSR